MASLQAPAAGARRSLALPGRPVVQTRLHSRRCFKGRCCAAQRPEHRPAGSSLQAVRSSCDAFLQRHDVLSTGMGSLLVTSYCVWRGQSPAMALGITVLATISGLVLNELFRED